MTSDDCFGCKTQQIPQNQLQHYCLNFGLEISCDVYFERAYHKVKQKPYHILSIFELCTEKIQINRSEISMNTLLEKILTSTKYLEKIEQIVQREHMTEYEQTISEIASDASWQHFYDLTWGMNE